MLIQFEQNDTDTDNEDDTNQINHCKQKIYTSRQHDIQLIQT